MCFWGGKKKLSRKLTLVTSVFFFPGKISQLSEENKRKKEKDILRGFVEKILIFLGYFLFPPLTSSQFWLIPLLLCWLPTHLLHKFEKKEGKKRTASGLLLSLTSYLMHDSETTLIWHMHSHLVLMTLVLCPLTPS